MEALETDNRGEEKMENAKVIASGGWIVSETIYCYGNCPEHKTIVTGFGGRIVGKFDGRISVSDARLIANAPNMVSALEDAYRSLSSVANGNYSRVSILCAMSVINRVIDKVKAR